MLKNTVIYKKEVWYISRFDRLRYATYIRSEDSSIFQTFQHVGMDFAQLYRGNNKLKQVWNSYLIEDGVLELELAQSWDGGKFNDLQSCGEKRQQS